MTMRFCPSCGTSLTHRFEAGRERPVCLACGFIGYRNPVPVGLIMAVSNGRLLLIRRSIEPLKDYWAPPTGYVEYDESVEQAVVREAKEEANVDVSVDRLIGVYSVPSSGVLMVAFQGRVLGGKLRAGEDAADAGLFAPDELPEQPAAHAGTLLDHWFHRTLSELLDSFRRGVIGP